MTNNGLDQSVPLAETPAHSLTALEKKLGYTFKNKELLQQALTHSSSVNDRQKSNERLEFLGDRVLGLVVADMLMAEFPNENEGALGYRFAALVRRESLERVAEHLRLEFHIKRENDPTEMRARQRSGLLANACEAVIAALYLDGGLVAAQAFIKKNWLDLLKEDLSPPKDSKTRLQEYAQSKGWALPQYKVVEQKGPDHAPQFIVEAQVKDQSPARGSGLSKRAAETNAAENMLLKLIGKEANG